MMRIAAALVAVFACLAVGVKVREHLDLAEGRYQGGTDWLIDLEYRVQQLEAARAEELTR